METGLKCALKKGLVTKIDYMDIVGKPKRF
jgi:hypothetical protein